MMGIVGVGQRIRHKQFEAGYMVYPLGFQFSMVQQDFSDSGQCAGSNVDLLDCNLANGEIRALPVEVYARAYLGPVFLALEGSMGLIPVYDESDEDTEDPRLRFHRRSWRRSNTILSFVGSVRFFHLVSVNSSQRGLCGEGS